MHGKVSRNRPSTTTCRALPDRCRARFSAMMATGFGRKGKKKKKLSQTPKNQRTFNALRVFWVTFGPTPPVCASKMGKSQNNELILVKNDKKWCILSKFSPPRGKGDKGDIFFFLPNNEKNLRFSVSKPIAVATFDEKSTARARCSGIFCFFVAICAFVRGMMPKTSVKSNELKAKNKEKTRGRCGGTAKSGQKNTRFRASDQNTPLSEKEDIYFFNII